ncbi:MAG TPA: YceI family protein [Acidobacteriaceae bacterium]|nr:YceI family protein [Acidobacteriaceae bacterium]
MKAVRFAVAALALVAPLAMAQTSTWKNDPHHSEVDFTIKHLTISNVHGRFGHIDATINYDEKDITKSTVKATIDITNLETGEEARDKHLKSPDFFDVEKFPSATFESTSVTKSGSGLQIAGNLTLKGVTKPVVLDVDGPTGPVQGMDQKPHVGFEATLTIHRSDFQLGSKFPPAVVGDEVKLTIELDAAKQ